MEWVGQVIDPIHGLLLDVWDRRWLMGLGAAGTGLSILTIGLAPTFALLLLAYALYGAAGGPLTHTGDVLVALVFWLGLDWRWRVSVAVGCSMQR